MELEEFYKNQYDTSNAQRNEINTSLSMPVSILTALIAGLLFALTSFNFKSNIGLSLLFSFLAGVSLFLLTRSIYHLTKAVSEFHNGYNYVKLKSTDVLDAYYHELIQFHRLQNRGQLDISVREARKEFDDFILKELIRTAGINQRNNESKTFQRFQCYQFMIFSLMSLSLLVIPYGIDFELNREVQKVQLIRADSILPIKLVDEDSSYNVNTKYKFHGETRYK